MTSCKDNVFPGGRRVTRSKKGLILGGANCSVTARRRRSCLRLASCLVTVSVGSYVAFKVLEWTISFSRDQAKCTEQGVGARF